MTDQSEPAHPQKAGSSSPGEAHHTSRLRQVTVTDGSGRETGAPDGEWPPLARHSASASLLSDSLIGCTIDGRYYVEAILGEGGMGVVYRCTHTIIGKKAAMKVLRADLARNDEVTERFLNEAKSASSIGNPHIIDISDFGRLPDGSAYFIMEYLEGTALSTVVDDGGPVPVERLIHIAEQLAEGLYAAHEAGIVHRDLKPDNIFLVQRGGQDFVKILDFGIAKASSTTGKLTQAGQVFGTPHYMSPEQAAGTALDHRADIYSLGVILYELASGRVPFDADNFMGILTQHMYKAPLPMRSLVPGAQNVPPGLEAIILKCLSKRPEQRYQTMYELREDLRKAREGQVPAAVTEMMNRSGGFNVPQDYFKAAFLPASSWNGRSRWPLYAGLGAIITSVLIVVALFTKSTMDDIEPALPEPVSVETKAATPESPPPPAPTLTERQQVILAVAPLDARVYRGDEDLGTSPVLIEVEKGDSVDLVVRKKGYKDAEVQVDGSQSKLSVALQPVQRAAPRAPSRPAPRPEKTAPAKPKSMSSEIVNPWE